MMEERGEQWKRGTMEAEPSKWDSDTLEMTADWRPLGRRAILDEPPRMARVLSIQVR